MWGRLGNLTEINGGSEIAAYSGGEMWHVRQCLRGRQQQHGVSGTGTLKIRSLSCAAYELCGCGVLQAVGCNCPWSWQEFRIAAYNELVL